MTSNPSCRPCALTSRTAQGITIRSQFDMRDGDGFSDRLVTVLCEAGN